MPIHLPPLSRRRFISRTLAASLGISLAPPSLLAAENAGDPNTWALLSDIHIAADRSLVARGGNMTDHLMAASREVVAWTDKPAGVIISGDCAYNSGETADYMVVADLLKPMREAGLPIHLMLGNHDDRERFWNALEQGKESARPVMNKHVAMMKTPRANFFLLDSLDKVLVTPGVLGEAQLEWLGKTLDANADKPAIIFNHHNLQVGEAQGALKDTARLMEILRPRKQVKAYFYGHTHTWKQGKDESGIHLINLPPVAYPFDKVSPLGWVQAKFQESGARLEFRCLDQTRKEHGQVVDLKWRGMGEV